MMRTVRKKTMNFTYLLRCADGSLYCGWTTDLDKRLKEHNAGKGAKYTKSRRPVELAYWEVYATKQEAMRREAAIKKLKRKEKEELILLCHKTIHHNIVAETSSHDKEMKDLMRTKGFVPGIKDRKLQGIDDSSNGIDNSSS